MNKEVQTKIKISQPITIKKIYKIEDSSNEILHCFDLKQNVFDPNKGSPPSSWTFRLLKRIEQNTDFN